MYKLQAEDEVLLSLLKNGDEDVFTVIYEKYHTLLYVVSFKYFKSKDFAQDAVQQIFLKLWETRSILNININLRNYLYTMLKNHILNEIRNNITELEKNYEVSQGTIECEDELLSRLEEKEISEKLYQAIDRLPDQKRQVCLYKLKENLSNQEIAEKMNISIPTVKTHYSLAIKLLRENLGKLFLFILI